MVVTKGTEVVLIEMSKAEASQLQAAVSADVRARLRPAAAGEGCWSCLAALGRLKDALEDAGIEEKCRSYEEG